MLLAGRLGFDSQQGHSVQTGFGAHPAFCPTGTRDLSLEVKRPGREADHSPSCSVEVKNVIAIPAFINTSLGVELN
jgi:hypothetical protein